LTSGWRVPVRRGAVGSDSSCRQPLWPRRGEGRQRRRAVVEVTGRSNGGLRLSEQWKGRGAAACCRRGVVPWRAGLEARSAGEWPGGQGRSREGLGLRRKTVGKKEKGK
jgi:hypothetical protein